MHAAESTRDGAPVYRLREHTTHCQTKGFTTPSSPIDRTSSSCAIVVQQENRKVDAISSAGIPPFALRPPGRWR
jgi:hypothetical protein